MRPTTQELLEVIDEALTRTIVPTLQDPYAKARSAVMVQIIGHLHRRTSLEGAVLWADNAELAELLGQLRDVAGDVDLDAALRSAAEAVPECEYPSVDLLGRRNAMLRAALVQVIDQIDCPGHPLEDVAAADPLIKAYLRRQLDRELELCTVLPLGDSDGSRDLPLV